MKRSVQVNAYERDPQARQKCIDHYGTVCYVCTFDFRKVYGKLGLGFIHVHHLTQMADMGPGAKTNPIRDLRPVCPNCHAMLHRRRPAILIGELKLLLHAARKRKVQR
jgi:5-methylcytosine-specific restriction protein A